MGLTYFLVIVAGLLILLLIVLSSVRAMKKKRTTGNGWNFGSYFSGLRSGNSLRIMLLVIVYLFLLYMIKSLFPEAWNWMWEKEVFWIIQGVVVSSVIIFSIGPRWSKILLFPILVLVLGIYVLEEVKIDTSPEIDQKSTVTEPAKEPTEAEIKGFLSNPSPPADLVVKKERGEIWDLRILYSGVVTRDEWTEVIELPTPPRKRHYRIEPEVLSGKVEVMNCGKYVGTYPNERFQLISRKPLRLQYRSENLPQTAIVIWRWTQGGY